MLSGRPCYVVGGSARARRAPVLIKARFSTRLPAVRPHSRAVEVAGTFSSHTRNFIRLAFLQTLQSSFEVGEAPDCFGKKLVEVDKSPSKTRARLTSTGREGTSKGGNRGPQSCGHLGTAYWSRCGFNEQCSSVLLQVLQDHGAPSGSDGQGP